jgi:glutamate-1-semialdehyde 2,1-aminomutase
MAAAVTTLELLEAGDAVARMRTLGRLLADGLVELGRERGVDVQVRGHVAMPTVTIGGDDDGRLMAALAAGMVAQGSLVHPSHNWFLSAAHSSVDVERTLEHAATALDAVAARVPA